MSDLFRTEAMDHKSNRFHGSIVLTRTWSYPALTAFFCAIAGCLVAFALCFGFTRKESVSGTVVPDQGLVRLAVPQAGVITQVYVREGQSVAAGAPLFLLSSERRIDSGGAQEQIQQTLSTRIGRLHGELEQQARQASNRRQALVERSNNLRHSLHGLDQELVRQRRRLQLVREVASRIGELADSGTVSRNAATERSAELLEQESRVAGVERERLALQRELTAVQAELADAPLASGRETSQLERNIEELKQQSSEQEALRQIVVRAPQAGRVAGVLAERGQSVAAGQRLASLMPEGSVLEAELYAPTRSAGFIHEGTPVLLRYDAFPYQKFGQFKGTVREISTNTMSLGELQGSTSTEPVYRIRVQLGEQQVTARGQPHALKPGMQLSATLVLEQRTLAEWVLEPLYGISR